MAKRTYRLSSVLLAVVLAVSLFLPFSVTAQADDPWWNPDWDYRIKLTFDTTGTTDPFTNTIVQVRLDNSNFNFDHTQVNGEDIRFIDLDGITELPYLIVNWDDTNEEASVCVRVPQVDANSTSDYMHMYCGNTLAIDDQSSTSTVLGTTDANVVLNLPLYGITASDFTSLDTNGIAVTSEGQGWNLNISEQINTATYDAFGLLLSIDSDTLVYIFRQGTSHMTDKGKIVAQKYAISTKSWGARFDVYEDANATYDSRGVGGGIIDNKVYLFFARYAFATTTYVDLGYIVSTDLTMTVWSDYTPIAVTPTAFNAYGKIVATSVSGTYFQTWYGHTGAAWKTGTFITTDSGNNWALGADISAGVGAYGESCIEYVPGTGHIAHIRDNDGNYVMQSVTVDNGVNWSVPTVTNLGAATLVKQPWLLYDAEIDRLIAVYHDRQDDQTKISVGIPSAVFADPTAWEATTVVDGVFDWNGYPSIVKIGYEAYFAVTSEEKGANDADTEGGFITYTEVGTDWHDNLRHFGGIGDYIFVTPHADMAWGLDDFTIIGIFSASDYTTYRSATSGVLIRAQTIENNHAWTLAYVTDDHITPAIRRTTEMHARDNVGGFKSTRSAVPIYLTKDVLAISAVKREDTDLYISVDGTTWDAGDAGANMNCAATPTAVKVGTSAYLPEDNNVYFQGDMDSLILYDKALSQNELDDLYEEESWRVDSSGVLYGAEEEELGLPTVTTQAADDIEDTTATGHGNITVTGGENCDRRGVVWNLATHGDPGNVAPGASDYANDVGTNGDFGTGAFTANLVGLPTGDTIYARAYAHNSTGYAYGDEVNFLTKPAAPTNVAASFNDPAKVVITWTKSTGATDYHVFRDAVDLGASGDVDTENDVGADAPTVTPGLASASDGTSDVHVTLSIEGELANNGTTYAYKVVASNATGDSDDSATDNGNRSVGALTYEWFRSDADADGTYGSILGEGGTTDPYNDTNGVIEPDGRWYYCELNATGAAFQDTTHNRGYRSLDPLPTSLVKTIAQLVAVVYGALLLLTLFLGVKANLDFRVLLVIIVVGLVGIVGYVLLVSTIIGNLW